MADTKISALPDAVTLAGASFDAVQAGANVKVPLALFTGAYQPLDADLTAIAALTTAAYGRSLLTLASTTLLAAEVDAFFLTPTEGDAAYQPKDADLTAIAALTTAAYGRSLLTLANATALSAEVDSFFLTPTEGDAAYQPKDSDLTTIAGLTATTDSFLQSKSSAWATRTIAQVRADLATGTVNVRAHNNGTDMTGFTSGNTQALVLGTEVFDNGAAFASGIWTPPAGLVIMHFAMKMIGTNLSASVQDAFILKNGAAAAQSANPSLAGAQPPNFNVTLIDIANGTDTYQPAARGFTSSSTWGVNGAAVQTYFEGTRFGQ